MGKGSVIKWQALTDNISYYIKNNTIYLFQNEHNLIENEINILYKKIMLIIEDNNVSYININAKNMEKKKKVYQDMGFILSYYDINKLSEIFGCIKDKMSYRCYGIMTKSDFLNKMKEQNITVDNSKKIHINSNKGFVSNLLLLFGGIAVLIYICIDGILMFIRK